MHQITEFSLHKNTRCNGKLVVVVKKNNRQHCWNIESLSELSYALEHLNLDNNGWLIDSDVGKLITHYTIKTHPEMFI